VFLLSCFARNKYVCLPVSLLSDLELIFYYRISATVQDEILPLNATADRVCALRPLLQPKLVQPRLSAHSANAFYAADDGFPGDLSTVPSIVSYAVPGASSPPPAGLGFFLRPGASVMAYSEVPSSGRTARTGTITRKQQEAVSVQAVLNSPREIWHDKATITATFQVCHAADVYPFCLHLIVFKDPRG
jgi:hypothetical protein